jgi:hypothetical protein
MSDRMQNTIQESLEELYRIDPELKQFEADLPRLLQTLAEHQPMVPFDAAFAQRLRASLLAAPAASLAPATAVPSPYVWWVMRLTPLGIALFLFVVLSPDEVPLVPTEPLAERSEPSPKLPPPTEDRADTARSAPIATNEPQPESAPNATEELSIMASDPTMLSLDAPQSALVVAPPLVGTTVTIASLTLTEAAWVVVYEDDGGAFGDILAMQYLEQGTYENLSVTLSRSMTYPTLVTIAVYTATSPDAFAPRRERIQTDPVTGEPMQVTVPVFGTPES